MDVERSVLEMRVTVGRRMRRGALGALVVAVPLALFGPSVVAGADPIVVDPGYPGPTSTTAPPPTNAEQDGGRVFAGDSVVIESCGFRPSGPEDEVEVDLNRQRVTGVDVTPEDPKRAAVSWNDVETGSVEVDDAGCARVRVTVHERDGSPPCPAVDVNGDGREGRRGRNKLVLRGEGANHSPRTVTTTLSISCSNGGGNGNGNGGGGNGSDGAAVGASNADAAAATGGPGVRAENASSERGITGRLASSSRMKWAAVNVVLLAVAVGLLLAEWRRRARRAVLSPSS